MKRIIAALSVALLLALGTSASGQTCSLTFELIQEDAALTGGNLTVYRVGNVEEDRYVPVEALKDFGLSFDALDAPELASQVLDAVSQADLTGYQEHITDGSVRFSGLEQGLYLVIQQEPCDGYSPISPFLITLPQFENGVPNYDVVAKPKVEMEPLPTESTEPTETEPTIPEDPELPQTGQLNWPIPVLFVGGFCLLIAGWLLRYGKKESHAT